jgi:ubiquitin-conjugating enzyme E2 O
MIEGPAGTPYEGGLFFFDCLLPAEYPNSPPSVHYISFVSDRLNPNLYEDGKVCVSLLGTWKGRGSEKWTKESSLLQVLVSIQGLILNKEPYYNEPGFEKLRGDREGEENSKKYNEMAVVKTIQTMSQLVSRPLPSVFRDEIRGFLERHGMK